MAGQWRTVRRPLRPPSQRPRLGSGRARAALLLSNGPRPRRALVRQCEARRRARGTAASARGHGGLGGSSSFAAAPPLLLSPPSPHRAAVSRADLPHRRPRAPRAERTWRGDSELPLRPQRAMRGGGRPRGGEGHGVATASSLSGGGLLELRREAGWRPATAVGRACEGRRGPPTAGYRIVRTALHLPFERSSGTIAYRFAVPGAAKKMLHRYCRVGFRVL
ncbi:hypothetical protein PVAP13_4NG278838 [Panicum virgatum]|uniref:Uncharacterized protein n=1 Tax=Panicum virgatum TaxID=38727 RepID=A0A8T0TDA9_PANVG|nr:hypothetical protein PVAP13_4NG278838 [Panicum virgatum]